MVVSELKNAVIDTVEFIIPPFIKLIIALIFGSYVTSGILIKYLDANIITYFNFIEIPKLKTVIDSLYLSSIVPILGILLIILLAYSINRISSFIGSLVPITYTTTTIIRNPFYVAQIWKYFPQVQSLYELRLKVTQLLSFAETSNISFPFEQIKWQEKRKQAKFGTLNFINFLLLWSIASYVIVHKYLSPSLGLRHLSITIFILLVLIIITCFRVVRNELDIETTELMIVDNFLRTSPEYKKTEDLKELEQIERLIKVEEYYNKRWWSLYIGYRMDWFKMYKYYKPPFYWTYLKWKERKEIRRYTRQ